MESLNEKLALLADDFVFCYKVKKDIALESEIDFHEVYYTLLEFSIKESSFVMSLDKPLYNNYVLLLCPLVDVFYKTTFSMSHLEKYLDERMVLLRSIANELYRLGSEH